MKLDTFGVKELSTYSKAGCNLLLVFKKISGNPLSKFLDPPLVTLENSNFSPETKL